MDEEQGTFEIISGTSIQGAQLANDFQLGIVTTDVDNADDAGNSEESSGSAVAAPKSKAIPADSPSQRWRLGTEEGLEAAEKALRSPLIFIVAFYQADADCVEPDLVAEGVCGGHNRGFSEKEAALEIIFVSDEDDSSTAATLFYVDFFKNLSFRNEGRFHAHAIVGADNGRAVIAITNSAQALGDMLVNEWRRTQHLRGRFGRVLQEIGNRAFGLQFNSFCHDLRERQTFACRYGQARAAG